MISIMKPSVVVISYSIVTSLSVIRSLGVSDYPVDLFFIASYRGKSRIVSSSKYVKKTTEVVGRNEEEIIGLLMNLYGKSETKWVLFPADDFCASLIDRHRDRLETAFLMPYIVDGGQGAITRWMDKIAQSECAARCGIPTVKEWKISLRDDRAAIPPDMVYPCFVKPLLSVDGRKTEMGVCANETELRDKLSAMRERDSARSVLVQQFMNITQEYSMSGVCMDQIVILPAIVKKHQIAQFRRGTTLVGELVSLETIEPLKAAICRFLKEIRYVGMFDMEVILADGKLYFGELNLRSGGPNYSYFASGVNLPELAVEAICGEEPRLAQEITLHKVFFHDQDGWEDYQHGYITKKQLNSYYDQADVLLLASKDDPKPGKVFLKEVKRKMRIERIKRIVRRIRRKKQ